MATTGFRPAPVTAGEIVGAVDGLYRYPVKAMAGECLDTADLDVRGFVGDREWAVYDGDRRLASGKDSRRFRRMDPIFELAAETTQANVSVVLGNGQRIAADDATIDEVLSGHFGSAVTLAREQDIPHHDAGSVSIIGTASLAAVGELLGSDGPVDVRRFRANLLVRTTQPWVEESWIGSRLRIGGVELDLVKRIQRCRMVDIAQVGLDRDGRILKLLGRQREQCLAVYADVARPGSLRVEDHCELL